LTAGIRGIPDEGTDFRPDLFGRWATICAMSC